MKKAPHVNDSCIGCMLCISLCEKVFDMDDNGQVHIKDPNGDNQENIEQAMQECPVGAIGWKECE